MSKQLPALSLRKPSSADPVDVERFMRGEPVIPLVSTPASAPAPLDNSAAVSAAVSEELPLARTHRAQLPAVTPLPYNMIPARPRTTLARRDGRVLHRTTIYLDTDLSRRVAEYCATENRSVSDAVAAAFKLLLASAR